MSSSIKNRLSQLSVRILIGLLAALTLFGCGGGGGGGGGSTGASSPSYTVSTNSVTFSATQGAAQPAQQTVQVAVTGGTVFIGTSQTGSGFTHTFNITGQTTGQITITPDMPNTPGTFTGSIIVTGCADQFCAVPVPGSPKIINVTYTVTAAVTPVLNVAPASLTFTSNTGALPSPVSQDVSLSLSSGSDTWLASVNYVSGTSGWLSLLGTGPVNTTPSAVTISVSGTPLTAEVRTATVTFTTNGGQSKTVNVTWTITANEVDFVAPYVATSSVPGNVIIRGHGFSNLNPATTTVQFGAAPASAATVVSDTEIHASYPALAAGTYAPAVTDGGVLIPNRAGVQLVVVAPPAFAAATVVRGSNPGGVGNLIYDAERQAVLLMDASNNRIYRYTFSGSWNETSVLGSGAGANMRIALSPDGTELLQTGGNNMIHRNPATLVQTASVSALTFLGGGGFLNMIDFANDGGAIVNVWNATNGITLARYDVLTQQFSQLSQVADMSNRTIRAAADGDILVMPSYEPLGTAFYKPIARYDATANSVSTVAATGGGTEHVSVSRDASRTILVISPLSAAQETRVYDASMALLGKLPDDVTAFAITPDGSTAYAYRAGVVQKFNLNSPPVGGFFVASGPGQTISSPGSFFSAMTISPDGGTLFIAGTANLIVLPAF